jgi:hypothetical protein
MLAAEQGPHVLFCIPNRTTVSLCLSVMAPEPRVGPSPKHLLAIVFLRPGGVRAVVLGQMHRIAGGWRPSLSWRAGRSFALPWAAQSRVKAMPEAGLRRGERRLCSFA